MEIHERKAVSDELKKYDHLAKDSDFIEVTEWANGEGWDISLNDKLISLTYGQLEAIKYLVKALDYNEQQLMEENMVTARNAKLLTSYKDEIKSNRLEQKYKYAIEGIEKEILWAAEEGRSSITWSYAANEIHSALIKEFTLRGFRVEYFGKNYPSYISIHW